MSERTALRTSLRRKPRPCDGSGECKSKRHLHGCYSDNGRNCDHPSEHLRVGMVVSDDGQLRRFA